MKSIIFYYIFCLSFIFISSEREDICTLSNYENITLVELSGLFEPDFENKIVKGDLIYNFTSNVNGNQIILDSKNLNIISISNIDNTKNFNFKFGEEDKNYGTPLIIDYEYKENEIIILNIKYETTSEGKSAFFVNKNQTLGGSHDYFFTISALIHGRELLPSQDTPAVKFVYHLGIKVNKDIRGMISGIFEKEEEAENATKIYYYRENIPVPNYLISLAAGNITEKQINENITIYSEPEFIDDAYNEFKDILPEILDKAILYIGPYEWEKFNLLFLPKSFPYSVLENPSLSFCSSFLVNGDQSLIDFIVHLVAASWAGNLVTHNNWRDLWISKGLRLFLQRKIISQIKNEDYAKMDNLANGSIDDLISHIPDEKGYNFLYYLESLIGTDVMEIFIKNYFKHFKYKSINLNQFKDYFIEICLNSGVLQETLDKINWDEWINKPGKCPIDNDFSNNYMNETNEVYEDFINGNYTFRNKFNNLQINSKIVVLQKILLGDEILTYNHINYFLYSLELENFLIKTNYFKLIFNNGARLFYYDNSRIINYLSNNSAIDYLNGIYSSFYKRDDELAQQILINLKNFLHPIAFDYFEKDIQKTKEEYPIIKIELKKKITCLYYKDKIEIKSDGYKDFLGNIETEEEDGIYLERGERIFYSTILKCYLNSTDKYCLLIYEIDKAGLYYLENKRIQKKNYAIKSEGYNRIEIYKDKTIVDETKNQKEYKFTLGYYYNNYLPIYFKSRDYDNTKILLNNEQLRCFRGEDKLMLECTIDGNLFGYDPRDSEEYQKYEIKVIGECGIEKYSFILKINGQ